MHYAGDRIVLGYPVGFVNVAGGKDGEDWGDTAITVRLEELVEKLKRDEPVRVVEQWRDIFWDISDRLEREYPRRRNTRPLPDVDEQKAENERLSRRVDALSRKGPKDPVVLE